LFGTAALIAIPIFFALRSKAMTPRANPGYNAQIAEELYFQNAGGGHRRRYTASLEDCWSGTRT
jgi:hypothetical protein